MPGLHRRGQRVAHRAGAVVEGALFRTALGTSGKLTATPMTGIDICRMVKRRLLDAGLPFAGVVANRVRHAAPKGDPSAELSRLLGDDALTRKVLRTFEEERRLAAQDRRNLADLKKRLGRKPMIEVPHLDGDVHDLPGLRRMDEYLFG